MNCELPKDLNEIDDWPSDFDVEDVLARLPELSLTTFQELMDMELLSVEDSVRLAREGSEHQTEVAQKLLWLQGPLLIEDLWPETFSDGWHTDYLELMWEILSISSKLKTDDEASEIFDAIAPHSWANPIAPAAILAHWPERASMANSVLREFLGNCAENEDGFEAVRDVAVIESQALVPIVAIASLYPGADPELTLRAVRAISQPKTADDPESTETLCSDFWDYFLLMLIDDRSTTDLWCPNVAWRDGFFMNGIADDGFQIDMVNLLAISELFLNENAQWHFENAYGEDGTRENLQIAMTQIKDALGSQSD